MSQAIEKVEQEVQRAAGPDARPLSFSTAYDHGVVLVHAPSSVTPWITWRWATALTDGSPVQTSTGAMLWAGHYYLTVEEAVADMSDRPAI